MRQPKLISASIATAIHDEALHAFGGLAGLREPGLLQSALDRPRNLLAYEPGSSMFQLAAALCVGVAKNHPFIDGNKRTALLSTCAFLHVNGHALDPSQEDEVITMLAVADGSMGEGDLATWLQNNCSGRRRR